MFVEIAYRSGTGSIDPSGHSVRPKDSMDTSHPQFLPPIAGTLVASSLLATRCLRMVGGMIDPDPLALVMVKQGDPPATLPDADTVPLADVVDWVHSRQRTARAGDVT